MQGAACLPHKSPPMPQTLIDPNHITLGENTKVDSGVLLGYKTARKIKQDDLTIGRNGILRAGTVIYAGTRIGDGFQTGHNTVVREENVLGDQVWIWSNTVIDYGCVIGHRVRIHSNVYIAQFTVIEDDVFVAPCVAVANDMVPVSDNLQGPILRKGARIGVNVTLLPGVEIGEGALIGAGSVGTKNIPAHCLAYGNPARVIKRVGEIRPRPKHESSQA